VSEENELPMGWAMAKVAEVADIVEPGFPYGNYNTVGKGFPQLRPMNIDGQGRLYLDELKYVDVANPPLLNHGDVLFNNTNSPVWVGKTTIIRENAKFTFSNHMTRVRLNPQAGLPAFFALQLQYLQQFGYFLARCNHHVNQASISSSYLATNVSLLVAPVSEQRRIVAAIEQQFTRLDAGIAALKRAKTKLKRYRAAMLKAAVEGKLTEGWRAEHPDTESASVLLERILAERRAKWEADLRAKGKDPAKVKYVEPAKPDVGSLPAVPKGWCWATVEQVCERIVDCLHSTPAFKEAGYICIDTNCIKPGRIIYEKVRYVDENTFNERNIRMKPQENDVLFSREGALLGVAVTVPANLEFCLGQRMMIFRLSSCVNAKYYESFLSSSNFRSQYASEITGTASPHLNIRDVCKFAIALPCLSEQQQIVSEVERRLSVVSQLEATVEANLKRAERLRQSILKEAFAGRLVPQDQGDEPAGVLLERIRREREEQRETQGNGKGNGANKRRAARVTHEVYADVKEMEEIDVQGVEQVSLWP